MLPEAGWGGDSGAMTDLDSAHLTKATEEMYTVLEEEKMKAGFCAYVSLNRPDTPIPQ